MDISDLKCKISNSPGYIFCHYMVAALKSHTGRHTQQIQCMDAFKVEAICKIK